MKRAMVIAAAALMWAGCGGNETPAPTATPHPTVATPTPPPQGPAISYFGILKADDTLVAASGVDDQGRSIFERPTGCGFVIVVEATKGADMQNPATSAFNTDGPPDLQIESNQNLGNGSTAVCDDMPGNFGGIPGTNPANFDVTQQSVVDALNDFGCRFVDGSGQPIARSTPDEGCVLSSGGDYGFASQSSQVEFCGRVTLPMGFAAGDTVLTARVLDNSGAPGVDSQIVVRIGAACPD